MRLVYSLVIICVGLLTQCTQPKLELGKTAKEILGNPNYTAISFGGFRKKSRAFCPTVEELKEDMRLLSAMDIRFIRTYSTQLYPHAERTLKAIRELKKADPNFEMYVMLGIWIECDGAWTESRDHQKENIAGNEAEFKKGIELAKKYPEIVKILAVGNESMVHWAESYFVMPRIVLKYVEQLQELKKEGALDSNLWITSSDNFASWGGGSSDYHNPDLTRLIEAVDYVSMHTYPFHDTHYNPDFWQIDSTLIQQNSIALMTEAMKRARNYAVSQYEATRSYVHQIAPEKPIHIGETGWSTSSHKFYGDIGSRAAGEFQEKLYYDQMRAWSKETNTSCFFFEAFDEPWKDKTDERGSENHFGLFNIEGEAKYVLWSHVDSAKFKDLSRGGAIISKTWGGDEQLLLSKVLSPASQQLTNNN